jgi:hypothetical protein
MAMKVCWAESGVGGRLIPMLRLAEAAGVARPARQQLSVPTDKGATPEAGLAGRWHDRGRRFDRQYAPAAAWRYGPVFKRSGSRRQR